MSGSWWTTYRLGSSRIRRIWDWGFRSTSPWSCTPVCGTRTIGRQGEDWRRRIGPKHPSWHPTRPSTWTGVWPRPRKKSRCATQLARDGGTRRHSKTLMLNSTGGSDGFARNTPSTITATTRPDTPLFLLSVLSTEIFKRNDPSRSLIFLSLSYTYKLKQARLLHLLPPSSFYLMMSCIHRLVGEISCLISIHCSHNICVWSLYVLLYEFMFPIHIYIIFNGLLSTDDEEKCFNFYDFLFGYVKKTKTRLLLVDKKWYYIYIF